MHTKLRRMDSCLDIRFAEFVVEMKPGAPNLRLSWPADKYYDLVRPPVQVLQLDVDELSRLALSVSGAPGEGRLHRLEAWLTEAAAGRQNTWSALPVLSRTSEGLEILDGRHRTLALSKLGALRVPVIVG